MACDIEQLIYTEAETARGRGPQAVAWSDGITEEDMQRVAGRSIVKKFPLDENFKSALGKVSLDENFRSALAVYHFPSASGGRTFYVAETFPDTEIGQFGARGVRAVTHALKLSDETYAAMGYSPQAGLMLLKSLQKKNIEPHLRHSLPSAEMRGHNLTDGYRNMLLAASREPKLPGWSKERLVAALSAIYYPKARVAIVADSLPPTVFFLAAHVLPMGLRGQLTFSTFQLDLTDETFCVAVVPAGYEGTARLTSSSRAVIDLRRPEESPVKTNPFAQRVVDIVFGGKLGSLNLLHKVAEERGLDGRFADLPKLVKVFDRDGNGGTGGAAAPRDATDRNPGDDEGPADERSFKGGIESLIEGRDWPGLEARLAEVLGPDADPGTDIETARQLLVALALGMVEREESSVLACFVGSLRAANEKECSTILDQLASSIRAEGPDQAVLTLERALLEAERELIAKAMAFRSANLRLIGELEGVGPGRVGRLRARRGAGRARRLWSLGKYVLAAVAGAVAALLLQWLLSRR